MESFIIAIESVIPIFIPIITGVIIRRLNWMSEQGISDANRICFRLFMPTLLFNNIYSANLRLSEVKSLFLICLAIVVAEFIFGFLFSKAIGANTRQMGVLIQGFFRINIVAMGLPLIQHLSNDVGTTKMAILITFFVPAFVIMSALLLEGVGNKGKPFGRLMITVAKNPLIIGALLAILLRTLDIKLPHVVMNCVADYSKTGATLILVLLGTSLSISSIRSNRRMIITFTTLKLFVLPAIIIAISVLLSFRESDLACILIFVACPVATSVYNMTEQMGGDARLAGEIVAISSMTSSVSLLVLIYILKLFQLI